MLIKNVDLRPMHRPGAMVLVVACLLALLTVPLARGRLSRLAEVELRAGWTIGAAIAVQVLTFTVFPAQLEAVGEPLHLLTYALAGAFLVANRHVPGLWIVGLGGAMNLTAIVANGGVMPATPSALQAAGLAAEVEGEFANSAAVEQPRLGLLGDVFAVPEAWPLSNVFSIGDVLVVVGLLVVLHGLSGSRLVPAAAPA